MEVKFFYLIAHDSMSRSQTEKDIKAFLADPQIQGPIISYTPLVDTAVLISVEFTRVPPRTPPPLR